MFRQTDFYSLSGPPAPGALGPAMHEPSKVLDFNYNPAQISQQQHPDCLASSNASFNQQLENQTMSQTCKQDQRIFFETKTWQ